MNVAEVLPAVRACSSSLDLPGASTSQVTIVVAAEIFFWCGGGCGVDFADVNACTDTSSLSPFLFYSHTVTAEMEQEAERNRTKAAVSAGS